MGSRWRLNAYRFEHPAPFSTKFFSTQRVVMRVFPSMLVLRALRLLLYKTIRIFLWAVLAVEPTDSLSHTDRPSALLLSRTLASEHFWMRLSPVPDSMSVRWLLCPGKALYQHCTTRVSANPKQPSRATAHMTLSVL